MATERASVTRRVLLVAAIALLAYAVFAEFLGSATSPDQPQQRQSSSYAVDDTGTRAYADLLAHYGFTVRRQVGSLETASLPRGATIMLLDAETLTPAEATRLMSDVAAGARLVVGGSDPPFLHRLVPDPPRWARSFRDTWTIDDAASFAGVHTVATGGEGEWSDPGGSSVVAGTRDAALVTTQPFDQGEIVFLADTTPLINKLIDRDDNAAFAVALAGRPGQTVVFAEGVHGFSGATGWRAIPTRWKAALLVLVVAFALLAWSRAVRLGPPAADERRLPPPRAEYLEAIGATLTRGHDRQSARSQLAAAARDALARRGIEVPATPVDGATAQRIAALAGVPADDVVALLDARAATDDATLLRAARAASAVQRATAPSRESSGAAT
jgi:hypothetical protein